MHQRIIAIFLTVLFASLPAQGLIADFCNQNPGMACCQEEISCAMNMDEGNSSSAEFCACPVEETPAPAALPVQSPSVSATTPVAPLNIDTAASSTLSNLHLTLLDIRDRSGTYLHLHSLRI